MMPKGWKEVKLGEVINHQKGYAFKSDSYITEGVRIIRISDTTRNSIHDNSPVYIDENETASLSQYKLNAEDIILSTVGSRPHLLDSMVGKAVKVPVKDRGALLNQNLVKIVPKNSLITNNYLFSMITKSKFNYFISTLVRGNANQVSITLKELFAYTFPLPPLPEQQKIAKILSTWDKAISATERLIDNSTQQKKALMQQLLTGKKRLLDDEGQRFEGEWEERKLSNLGSTFNGLTGKTKVDFGSGKKYIPYMNIFKNTFIDTDNLDYVNIDVDEKQNTVQFGDVFFTTSSETPEEVGMSSILLKKTKEPIYLNSFCFGFRLFEIDKVAPAFIGYILRSSHVRRKIAILAQGATRYNLSKVQLLKISIALPSLEEQQKIATVLTNADREIELLEQQLADLQQEKKALMQVLLTGKKRVRINDRT